MSLQTTTAFNQINAIAQKEPIIVLEINGLPYVFSSNQVYTGLHYDDAGVYYNGVYNYDGLRPLDPGTMHAYIDRKKSFSTISQKLEQWDGRSSVETFNMSIIDKDGLLTDICTPGNLIPDIINAKVNIYFGYKVLSYPDDYLRIFKGYVNQYQLCQGFVNFLFTDPSGQKKQDLFDPSMLLVTYPILTTDTIINLSNTQEMYYLPQNPKGFIDTTVTLGIILGNEIITYNNSSFIYTATVSDGSLVIGQWYSIVSIGSTNWTTLGVPFGTTIVIGLLFQAIATSGGGNGLVIPVTLDGSFIISQIYTIYQIGNTNWYNAGVPPGTPITQGLAFTATSSGGSGNGTATSSVADGSFIIGIQYTITFLGTTDWQTVGVPTTTIAVVGLTFTAIATSGGGNGLANVAGQLAVNRAQYGTSANTASIGDTTTAFINFIDNPITILLKCMLSGLGGQPWVSNVPLRGIVNLDGGVGGVQVNTITFGLNVDLIRDYGLIAGDFVTLSGSSNPTNNNVFTILDIINNNRTVLVKETGLLIQENPPSGGGYLTTVAALTSKYDTYPKTAGLSLNPQDDVFVSQHEYIRNTFLPVIYNLSIKGNESNAKTFFETDLLKPIGAYSLTQSAKISVGCTHPPLSVDLNTFLDHTNVINAKNIVVTRGLNTRFWYNEIIFNYGYDIINGVFSNALIFEDAESQSRLNQVSTLQIDCKGFPGTVDSATQLSARAARLLQRYRFSAETIALETFFSVGNTIDAGDTVVLNDHIPAILQISNTQTGERGIYNRIMEVQERTINLGQGTTKLILLSNNGFSLTDRYAVIGPASILDPNFTQTSSLIRVIEHSFSTWINASTTLITPNFESAEYEKWKPYNGGVIKVFNANFTQVATATFTQDLIDLYQMHLSPPLPFTPDDTFNVCFEDYDSSSSSINSLEKAQFCSWDPTSPIASASSSAVFVLQAGYSSRYQSGMFINVQSPDCTRFSPVVKIISVIGSVVTIGPIDLGSPIDLGFIPQAGDLVQLGGFLDGGSAYRLI